MTRQQTVNGSYTCSKTTRYFITMFTNRTFLAVYDVTFLATLYTVFCACNKMASGSGAGYETIYT